MINKGEQMMKTKRLFAGIFCMVIIMVLFAGVGVTALADEQEITVDNISYILRKESAGDAYHVKSGKNASGDVVIPAEVNGIPVTEISTGAFEVNCQIKSVTMSDNIIRVHSDAFTHCEALSSVTIGANVFYIGSWAFDSCFSLTSITLNDQLTAIQKETFRNCGRLKSVTAGMGLKTIEENAFEGCKALETVILPDSVSLEGTGVGEEVRVSLNEKLEAELPEMMAQRDEMQAELDAFNSRIEAVREFLRSSSTNSGSVFGSGNIAIIIVGVVIIAAIMIGGIVISRKNRAAGQKEEELG